MPRRGAGRQSGRRFMRQDTACGLQSRRKIFSPKAAEKFLLASLTAGALQAGPDCRNGDRPTGLCPKVVLVPRKGRLYAVWGICAANRILVPRSGIYALYGAFMRRMEAVLRRQAEGSVNPRLYLDTFSQRRRSRFASMRPLAGVSGVKNARPKSNMLYFTLFSFY